ncbi:uncharacterized protein K452DRAFT_95894 [Aplosporella prunicola CBS 121167]|uniref:Uncharacterized protein n=1 Tax=Aplosporella prunicola CBS 121167 TaxID=1176127 RepID=A0A6A6B1U9_9PEZI|nr:uncharacterized protein K452DRAFT_95894 [Aplosporella prunicola CBS 121167]KAF2138159.1 hypothetical protein K452DRAFT_95894 [Aplosporella prunicola CBS 121167]
MAPSTSTEVLGHCHLVWPFIESSSLLFPGIPGQSLFGGVRGRQSTPRSSQQFQLDGRRIRVGVVRYVHLLLWWRWGVQTFACPGQAGDDGAAELRRFGTRSKDEFERKGSRLCTDAVLRQAILAIGHLIAVGTWGPLSRRSVRRRRHSTSHTSL